MTHKQYFYSFPKVQHGYSGPPMAEPARELDASGKGLLDQNNYSNIPHDGKQHTPLYERLSPINPAHGGSSNHADPAFFTTSSTSSSSENEDNTGSTAKWVANSRGTYVGKLCHLTKKFDYFWEFWRVDLKE